MSSFLQSLLCRAISRSRLLVGNTARMSLGGPMLLAGCFTGWMADSTWDNILRSVFITPSPVGRVLQWWITKLPATYSASVATTLRSTRRVVSPFE